MDPLQLFTIVILIILSFDVLIALVYTLSIIFVHRFHTHQNILTANTTLVSCICACFYIYVYVVVLYYPTTFNPIQPLCITLQYGTIVINFLVIYSFVTITINRYLSLAYQNKPFFKRKAWVYVCIEMAWSVSFLFSIPRLVTSFQVNIIL
mgnify:CR=1 FL=1